MGDVWQELFDSTELFIELAYDHPQAKTRKADLDYGRLVVENASELLRLAQPFPCDESVQLIKKLRASLPLDTRFRVERRKAEP